MQAYLRSIWDSCFQSTPSIAICACILPACQLHQLSSLLLPAAFRQCYVTTLTSRVWPPCIILRQVLQCGMALRCKPGHAAAVRVQSLPSTAAFLSVYCTMRHTVLPTASALHISNMPFCDYIKFLHPQTCVQLHTAQVWRL
jgi:hypothetical protein